MQKVSYMGNGKTTEFYFNFPYFEDNNIVVSVNDETAPAYNIVGTSGGENADFPFICGKVVFDVAPRALDCIVIARQLPLARVADYQPLAQINPTTLNQDLNYLMEVIKDRKDELDELCTQYSEIADKESTTTLLARISAIHDEIVAIDAKITALGDISTLRTDVSTNRDNIATNTNNIATNTENIATLQGYDYVVASQSPTAENNYTWYRKYKSGWVEQGGYYTGNATTVTLPVQMSDTNYSVLFSKNSSPSYWATTNLTLTNISNNSFSVVKYGDSANMRIGWLVSGFAQ